MMPQEIPVGTGRETVRGASTTMTTTAPSEKVMNMTREENDMSQKLTVAQRVMALRQKVSANIKALAKAMRPDMNKFIVGGAVDQDIDSDMSLLGQVDDLVQIDVGKAVNALAEIEKFCSLEVKYLKVEERNDMTEAQFSALKTLYKLEKGNRDEKQASFRQNRISILEGIEEENKALDMELAEIMEDDRNEDERIYDQLESIFHKTRNIRGHEFVMWLKEHAKDMTRDQLIDWSKKLNKRRFSKTDNQLSYDIWVAGKILIEKYLSKRGLSVKERAKASEEFAKRIKEWEEHDLSTRFAAHAEEPLQEWQMDTENPIMGKASLSYRKYEEYCDMARAFGDRHVAMGFILSNEEDYQIKEGTDLLSDIILALIRCEGNKSAAAIMCGLPRTTYRRRLDKALKVVNQKLDEGAISKDEHRLIVELL